MLACAQYIKEIGRGKDNPRPLSYENARTVWTAMLEGEVSELEMGAILLALRIKGESVDEIAGFLDACEAQMTKLNVPSSAYLPVVIPSYNGARNMPNLTPLLALLLAREGVPVLVQGKLNESDISPDIPNAPSPRVTTAQIFDAMGFIPVRCVKNTEVQMARGEPVFLPIQNLHPKLVHILSLRRILGVRNSAHTLVKILQPFAGPALRLVSYTHPEYQQMLTAYFNRYGTLERGDVLLSRGTEGEAVANARRAQPIEWFHPTAGGMSVSTVVASQSGSVSELPILPVSRDAASTAVWTQAVVSGERPLPEAIAQQVDAILRVLKAMRSESDSKPMADVA